MQCLLMLLLLAVGDCRDCPTCHRQAELLSEPTHDQCRSQRDCERGSCQARIMADAAFLAIMLVVNPHTTDNPHRGSEFKRRLWIVRSFLMYFGIRIGGGWAWQNNAKAIAEQEGNDRA